MNSYLNKINSLLFTSPKILEEKSESQKMKDRVERIANEVGLNNIDKNEIKITRHPLAGYMASAFSNNMYFAPILLFDINKLPDFLKPKDSNDPRLFDLDYLQKISDFLSDYFCLPRQRVSMNELHTLKTILLLKDNPEKFEKSIKTLIAHEMGHIHLKHSQKKPSKLIVILSIFSILIGLLSFGTLALTMHLLLAAILGTTLALTAFMINTLITLPVLFVKKQEKEADNFAITRLKNKDDVVQGFEYGFSQAKKACKEMRKKAKLSFMDNLKLKLSVLPSGEVLPLILTHGSFESRINRAKKELSILN